MSDIVEEDQVVKEDSGLHANSRKGWNVKKVEVKYREILSNSMYKMKISLQKSKPNKHQPCTKTESVSVAGLNAYIKIYYSKSTFPLERNKSLQILREGVILSKFC